MKITETPDEELKRKMAKQIANRGCDICPCCGETKTMMEYVGEGIYDKGIFSGGLHKSWVKGFLKFKHMRCDCYSCLTCGAEWESEPYEW